MSQPRSSRTIKQPPKPRPKPSESKHSAPEPPAPKEYRRYRSSRPGQPRTIWLNAETAELVREWIPAGEVSVICQRALTRNASRRRTAAKG
jgi:hypothetical protein